jgi:modulator of FtsH protease
MQLNDWNNFFLGELGAAAAFAGLLFVSVSVNQQRILALGRMADRGLEALGILVLVMIVSSLALVPGQSLRAFGIETFVIGFILKVTAWMLQRAYLRALEAVHRKRSGLMVALTRVALALIVLGGAILAVQSDSVGLYVLVPGVLLCFVAAGANAWVLLIEINR